MARAQKGKAQGTRRGESPSPLEKEELLAVICDYFCGEGLSATEIRTRLKAEFSLEITREEPYLYIREAARRGWIHFTPPPAYALERKIRDDRYPWLRDASVVYTATCEGVADRGARTLLNLLKQRRSQGTVHVGFSGGYALRTLAQRFGELLREPAKDLPREIVFHALVAGFDADEPTTDPNAFFTYFVKDPAVETLTRFVALHAPAMVDADLLPKLRIQPGIAKALERAGEIEIIVTSASCWADEHSMLRSYMEAANQSADHLEEAGCIGDMLWQPIGPDGPMDLHTKIRAMTIQDLSQLSSLVERGTQVLLVAGPCTRCHRPKTEVVKAILDQEEHLVTHLVVDSRCARALL